MSKENKDLEDKAKLFEDRLRDAVQMKMRFQGLMEFLSPRRLSYLKTADNLKPP